ncbi:MAG: fibronectin type III domain-containing protein [Syntrophobacteraceae bacterium]
MAGKGMIIAILAVLLTATVSWAFGTGGMGGVGSVPAYLLMPDPPTNVTASAGNGEATVSFKPPKSDGGSPITSYTVRSHPGKIKASGKQSPITLRGLTNGRTYTFTVTASNSVGTGIDSEPSNSVAPNAE